LQTKNTPKERRGCLIEELAKIGIDLAIISEPRHVYYLTGFTTRKLRYVTFLILNIDSGSSLFLGESEAAAARAVFDEALSTYEDYAVGKRMVAYADFVARELSTKLAEMKVSNLTEIGIEDWHLPQAYATAVSRTLSITQFIPISNILLSLRKTKGKDELASIREAAQRLDIAYGVAKPRATVGRSEMDLYREVNSEFFNRFGPDDLAKGEYSSGERTLGLGWPPTHKTIRDGETIILDLQTSSANYWADTARTFVAGKSSEKQERILSVLLEAKRKAEALLKPGTKGKEIHRAVFQEISNAGYAGLFPHQAGHGLGLEDQEPPFFLPSSEDQLEEGVACAIEPGIYEPSVGGIRIEDNYIITKDGFETISKFPFELT
jgi:Xaa-Pro dipeptidase